MLVTYVAEALRYTASVWTSVSRTSIVIDGFKPKHVEGQTFDQGPVD